MQQTPSLPRAVRLVLRNGHGHVLLLQRARSDGSRVWVTPGAPLLDGETFDGAAGRCLRDLFPHCVLRRPAWTASSAFPSLGRLVFQEEQFFIAEVPHFVPDARFFASALAREDGVVQARWWSLTELSIPAPEDEVFPRDLAGHLRLWTQAPPAMNFKDVMGMSAALDASAVR